MATTLSTVLDLQATRLEADAGTLTRSLYEHAVHFAWLAGDPARINRWRQEDMEQRLKADNDMKAHGRPMLTPENRARFEREVALIKGGPLRLEQLAIAADKSWEGRLRGLSKHRDLNSFSGLYALLYRSYSPMAHPSEVGLLRVAEEVGPGRSRVQLEAPSSRSGPWGIACVVFTAALLVAGESLGWPDRDRVFAIYGRNE